MERESKDSNEPFGQELNEDIINNQEKKDKTEKADFSFKCKILTTLVIFIVIFIIIIIFIAVSYKEDKEDNEFNFNAKIFCVYNVLIKFIFYFF